MVRAPLAGTTVAVRGAVQGSLAAPGRQSQTVDPPLAAVDDVVVVPLAAVDEAPQPHPATSTVRSATSTAGTKRREPLRVCLKDTQLGCI